MQISKRCEYALRAVFELALRNPGQPVKIHEIAGAQNIPPRFLEVILNQLRQGGFVASRRGNEGGYVLSRLAQELTVGEVIQCIQGPVAVIGDKTKRSNKSDYFYGDYAFEELWQKVNRAISEVYDNITFAEMVELEASRKTALVPNYAI